MRILISSIYPYVFVLLYLIIPFDEYVRALPNILMAILVVAFPFVVKKEDFKKLLIKPTIILVLFFVFLLVNSFFQGNLQQDIGIINKMMIPIGLVFLYLPISDFKKLKKAIVFSSFIAIVFAFIQFVVLVNLNQKVSLIFFQETVDALLIDRIYIGLLSVLSIIIAYQALTKIYHPDNVYYLISIILNVLYLFLIMSKTAIIILLVLVIVRQFYGPKKTLRLLITFGLLIIVSIFGYVKLQEPIKNLLKSNIKLSEINYKQSSIPLGYRTIIWDCTQQISTENTNTYFGIGFKNTKKELISCYESNIKDQIAKQNFIKNRFNTHNQYADFYISSGLVSLILFLGVLIFLLEKYQQQFFPTALVITIILFGMVENYLHRQVGAYYIGFILAMLLVTTNQNSKIDTKLNKDNTRQ